MTKTKSKMVDAWMARTALFLAGGTYEQWVIANILVRLLPGKYGELPYQGGRVAEVGNERLGGRANE